MVQTLLETELEQNEIVILIPEQIGKKKLKQEPKKKFFTKFSKSHKKTIDINKLKNKIDANIYRGGFFLVR